jgi:hypothetical protein
VHNTTGCYNVAVGYSSLQCATTASSNVAMGFESLFLNTTGINNSALGTCSLRANTTGTGNTVVGKDALVANTTGADNTGLGTSSGLDVTTGSNNVLLGHDAGRSTSPSGSITTQSNRIVLGNNSITNAYIKVAWTVTSDLRDKTNFGTVPHGLDFVNQLEPVSFQFKKSREDDTPHGDVRYGFKAQDILALEGDNPVIIDDEQPDHLKYKGEHLVPVLVNAIKELKAQNEDLKSRIEVLENS